MLKKTKSRINYLVLQELLEYSKPVEYRKRVIGHGLKSVDFSKYVTRKIFRMNLGYFLKRYFITELRTSDGRSQYYSITPQGICHLIKYEHLYDRITTREIKKIFQIMYSFYDNSIGIKSKIFGSDPPNFQHLYQRLNAVYDSHDMRESLDHFIDELISIGSNAVFSVPIFDNVSVILATMPPGGVLENQTIRKIPLTYATLNDGEFYKYFVYYFFICYIFFMVSWNFHSSFRGKQREDEANMVNNLDEEILRCALRVFDYVFENLSKTISLVDVTKNQLNKFQFVNNPNRRWVVKH